MRTVARTLLLSLALASAACAPVIAPQSGYGDGARHNSTVIEREDIAASSATNAYDLIKGSHPLWLERRGAHSVQGADDIVVYIDNARFGGVASLRQIQLMSIMEVRYFDAAAANYRFGPGHSQGAIQLLTGSTAG